MKHRTLALLVAATSLALIGGTWGCGGDDAGTSATGLSTQELSAASVPNLDDLVTRLDLTAAQRTQMEAALAQLRTGTRECLGTREQRRDGSGPHAGRGKFRMREEAGMGPRPMMGFLEECAGFLDQGQFVSLVNLMAEQRSEHMAQRKERREGFQGGFREGHQRMRRGDGENALGLTEEQRTQLRELRQEHRETMQNLHEQFRAGTITAEQLRDQAHANRTAMEEKVAGILTAEQLAQMQERRTERQAKRAERQLERLDTRQDHMASFLTKVLLLDEAQQGQLAELGATLRTRTQTMLQGVIDGSLGREDAMYERHQIRIAFESGLTSFLDADQIQRWEALQSLLPQGPPRGF